MALEHAADGDGDRAVFLRHDDDHGVGDLAGADARAVARAEVAGQVRIVAQGHHAARGRDAPAADDDRAVMQGGIFEKQVAQQLLGQLRVDDGAGFKVFVERRLAFKHEQHADALARHDLAGLHGGVDGALLDRGSGLGGKQVEMQLCADPLERAAQLGLEDDDEGDRADLKDLVEQPI